MIVGPVLRGGLLLCLDSGLAGGIAVNQGRENVVPRRLLGRGSRRPRLRALMRHV